MAKKKQKILLENVELKPQVIGKTYVRKSNLGRIIFIFACFILVIYYINDISLFINNILGRNTAETIVENVNNNKDKENKEEEEKNIVYNVFSNNLVINEAGLVINNFNYANNTLTFDANNNTLNTIDLSAKKYFLEIYNSEKTLINRYKINFSSVKSGAKISFSFNVNSNFYYLVIIEKTIDDYPEPNYKADNEGAINISCTKGIENIAYRFVNNELTNITHTIKDNNVNDELYNSRFLKYQNYVNSYSNYAGITATFNSTANGYSAVLVIAAEALQNNNITEDYYFSNKENIKVVSFEMQTYGFECK